MIAADLTSEMLVLDARIAVAARRVKPAHFMRSIQAATRPSLLRSSQVMRER